MGDPEPHRNDACDGMLSRERETLLGTMLREREEQLWIALLSSPPSLLPGLISALKECSDPLPHALFELTRIGHERASVSRECWSLQRAEVARAMMQRDLTRALARRALEYLRSAGLPDACQRQIARAERAVREVKDELIVGSMRLVYVLVRRYQRSDVARADLVQEGTIGLIVAAERWDYQRGLRFATYAAWWVRHMIQRAITNTAPMVRLPVNVLNLRRRAAQAIDRTRNLHGGDASPSDVSEQIHVRPRRLDALRALPGPVLLVEPHALDASESSAGQHSHGDASDPEQRLMLEAWRSALPDLLKPLSRRESEVLRQRFGLDGSEPMTLREIADKYRLSRERVRQLEERAIGKIRHGMRRARLFP